MSPEEIRRLVVRARRSLRSARNLLEDGDHDFSMSRAYYAMFYAAKAALLVKGVTRSRHSGVVSAFGEQFVRTGELGREVQAAFRRAFDDRLEGDYGDVFPPRDDVERRLEEARSFVDAVEDFLRGQGIPIDPKS